MRVYKLFWEKDIETLEQKGIKDLQLDRLNNSLNRIASTSFYKNFYLEKGYNVKPIKNLEQMRELPFMTKDDLRKSYPAGFVVIEKSKIVRLHSSSGTTGTPTVIYHTKNDIDNWSNMLARCLTMIGTTSEDIFQNMMSYGLFSGGLGLHYGAEKIGMLVIPISSGNTQRQIKFMRDFKTTIIHITPSYALHLAETLRCMNIFNELYLRIGLMGAEPYTEATRKKIENLLNIDVFNSYGLSEMNGPGVAFECQEKEGMHLWEDNFYLEVINPSTGETLPDGEEGELVISAINREAMPLLRYRTRDLAFVYPDKCRCGRTHRRISRIKGRTDDMFIIGGVNIFPSQIEHVLMKIPEVGTNYQIILWTKGALDKLTVKIEVNSEFFAGDLKQLTNLRETISRKVKDEILVTPVIELVEHGSLPPSEGKAIRVLDMRPNKTN